MADVFEPDGSLLDAYVFDVSVTDWQHVLDVVRTRGWWFEYTSDNSSLPLPEDVREIFDHRGDAATTLHIRPAAGILINTHFFCVDEIEFDLDPREFRGQDQIDVLCSFLRTIGSALGRSVVLTPENVPECPMFTYVAADDQFTARHP